MSTILATGHQIGLHANTLNNFTWYQANTPNGSILFGQGNHGNVATLLTVSNTTFTFSTNVSVSGTTTLANVSVTGNTTLANLSVSGTTTLANAVVTSIAANGSIGTNGQVLTSNGSASYWATSAGATTGKAIAMAIVFGG